MANVQITQTHPRQFCLDFRTLELGHCLVIGTCLPTGHSVMILLASNLHPLTSGLYATSAFSI
jgi:hypothetical protein